MRKWIRKALAFIRGKPTYWGELDSRDFIAEVSVDKTHRGQEITVRFEDRIKDGNPVAGISILYDGQAIYRDGLLAGESSYTFGFERYRLARREFDVVLTDEDDQVFCTNTVILSEAWQ